MKVVRAVGQGLSVTHRGWPVIAVIFVFYAVVTFFSAPNEDIPPYMKSIGDWGVAILIFAVTVLGVNYLLAGVQIFAKDGIAGGQFRFKGFFGNCTRNFLGQLGISVVIWVPVWVLTFLMLVLLSGAVTEARMYPAVSIAIGACAVVLALLLIALNTLVSMSWAIAAADRKGVFRSIWTSVLFCGRRFFSILGLLVLTFALAIVISLTVWIAYAFVVQGLRHLGLDSHTIILRAVTGCALYAYFFLFVASSVMSYYLNNRKEDERYN